MLLSNERMALLNNQYAGGHLCGFRQSYFSSASATTGLRLRLLCSSPIFISALNRLLKYFPDRVNKLGFESL
jgi:hypothetical protein